MPILVFLPLEKVGNNLKKRKLLSALSYFSILFLPVILPIIVWIVGEEEKLHAKKALALHLSVIVFLFAGGAGWYITTTIHGGGELDTFLFFGLLISVCLWAFPIPFLIIWNIAKGFQVLFNTSGH